MLREKGEITALDLEEFDIGEPSWGEVIAESLIGSMEGNFIHAMEKKPENIFEARNEDAIVLGNAGVVRVISTGSGVPDLREGDLCILFGNARPDGYGYPVKVSGYDCPGSIGLFAKKIRIKSFELIKLPKNTKLNLEKWAMFSLKFVTAWSNWQSAFGACRLQIEDAQYEDLSVWGWGGGVSYAELRLAKLLGCSCGMILSKEKMEDLCRENGIETVSRKASNAEIVKEVMGRTGGKGVSIFIDNIGAPTYNLTTRMTAREGVITTCGWKAGGMYPVVRPYECIMRHTHIFTHYASRRQALEAMKFAENNNWVPGYGGEICAYENIPDLAKIIREGKADSYFSLYGISED